MKKLFSFLLLWACLIFSSAAVAQLNGVYTVPGSFTSVAATINSLNIGGITGAVTINIAAGYNETAPTGGLQLGTISGCSAVSPITFKKNGTGSNPVISAYAGGTATAASPVQDGIWWLIGSDYITIESIDLADPNTSNPATMEFGFGLFKADAANGCQNNTIKNCAVTLNRLNGTTGAGTSPNGSRCIDVSCNSYSANTSAVTTTAVSGTNSNNKFYGNILQNCHIGIEFRGYAAAAPFTFRDNQNDVGGLLAATGNTIVNFGGGGTGILTHGLEAVNQSFLNVSFNYFNNNNGSGSIPTNNLYAINVGSANETNVSINSNTIILTSAGTNSFHLDGIYNNAGTSFTGTSIVNINNNVFPGYNYTNSINGVSQIITNIALGRTVNINNNLIDNIHSGTSAGMSMIYCSNGSTCSISNNTITNVTADNTPSNSSNIGVIGANGYIQYINANKIDNISCNSTTGGYVGAIYGSNSSMVSATNNSITNIKGNRLEGISFDNFPSPYTCTVTSNLLSDFSSAPGSTEGSNITGVRLFHSSNVLNPSTLTINSNTISSFTSSGSVINSFNTGSITGIFVQYHQQVTISKNKIYSFYSNGVGTVEGLRLNSNADVSNNLIGDLRISNSTSPTGIFGINALGQSIMTLYYNTVYLNNTINNSTNSGSTALFLGQYGLKTLKNNIFTNTSASTGTGVTSAMQLTVANTYTSYSTSSNNNLFYAGTPSANSVIMQDLSTSVNYTSLPVFKAFVSPREAQSVSENPPFISTSGATSNFLDINPAVLTQVESGGVPISGITTDFAGKVRNSSSPDIGAWEGNFLKADNVQPVILNSGFTGPPCSYTTRTFTIAAKDTSGIATGTVAPRLYYKVNNNPYTSVQGTLTAGTNSVGVWAFNLSYNASAGDVIFYFVTMQDQSYLNNLLIVPATGALGNDVNSIITPPSTPTSYTLPLPTVISATGGTICTGGVFQITVSGASTYTFSGGSATVSPTVNTTYYVTGTSSLGCPASNTAAASVTVYPIPVLSVNSGTLCSGQSFSISASGAQTYIYSGGSSVVSPSVTSTYTVTGVSAFGCQSAKAISTVSVSPAPAIQASASTTVLCRGDSITLHATGGDTYTWQPGGVNGPHLPISPASSSTYSVSGSDQKNCSSTSRITIDVEECVGVQQPGYRALVTVYPIPAKNFLHIEIYEASGHFNMEIYDVLDQRLRSAEFEGSSYFLDLQGLSAGSYYLKLRQGDSIMMIRKIVVE